VSDLDGGLLDRTLVVSDDPTFDASPGHRDDDDVPAAAAPPPNATLWAPGTGPPVASTTRPLSGVSRAKAAAVDPSPGPPSGGVSRCTCLESSGILPGSDCVPLCPEAAAAV
jgi:hypothetical protein